MRSGDLKLVVSNPAAAPRRWIACLGPKFGHCHSCRRCLQSRQDDRSVARPGLRHPKELLRKAITDDELSETERHFFQGIDVQMKELGYQLISTMRLTNLASLNATRRYFSRMEPVVCDVSAMTFTFTDGSKRTRSLIELYQRFTDGRALITRTGLNRQAFAEAPHHVMFVYPDVTDPAELLQRHNEHLEALGCPPSIKPKSDEIQAWGDAEYRQLMQYQVSVGVLDFDPATETYVSSERNRLATVINAVNPFGGETTQRSFWQVAAALGLPTLCTLFARALSPSLAVGLAILTFGLAGVAISGTRHRFASHAAQLLTYLPVCVLRRGDAWLAGMSLFAAFVAHFIVLNRPLENQQSVLPQQSTAGNDTGSSRSGASTRLSLVPKSVYLAAVFAAVWLMATTPFVGRSSRSALALLPPGNTTTPLSIKADVEPLESNSKPSTLRERGQIKDAAYLVRFTMPGGWSYRGNRASYVVTVQDGDERPVATISARLVEMNTAKHTDALAAYADQRRPSRVQRFQRIDEDAFRLVDGQRYWTWQGVLSNEAGTSTLRTQAAPHQVQWAYARQQGDVILDIWVTAMPDRISQVAKSVQHWISTAYIEQH